MWTGFAHVFHAHFPIGTPFVAKVGGQKWDVGQPNGIPPPSYYPTFFTCYCVDKRRLAGQPFNHHQGNIVVLVPLSTPLFAKLHQSGNNFCG